MISEGGQDTAAYHILGHFLYAFSGKSLEILTVSLSQNSDKIIKINKQWLWTNQF